MDLIKNESYQSYLKVAQVLAICCLIKMWSLFQLYKTGLTFETMLITLSLAPLAGLLLGKWVRLSAVYLSLLFFLAWHGFILANLTSSYQTHHVQLLILMLVGMSLFQRPQQSSHTVVGSGFQLIRMLVLIIYVGGVKTKLTADYLDGHQMKMLFLEFYWGSQWIGHKYDIFFQGLAWLSIFMESLIVALLLWPCLKRVGVWLGISFHVLLFILLPVSIFSILMIVGLCLFNLDSKPLGNP